MEQQKKIFILKRYISRIEGEISLVHLHKTFDFQDTPKGLVRYIFKAARERNYKNLRYLVDPYADGDNEAFGLCLVAMQPKEMQENFVVNFQNARIMGGPKINSGRVTLEIAIGPGSSRLIDVDLVKRRDKWYLLSF